ncbi:MAG: TlpA family protein disulfide reductase, partial [Comamonadaceae bacterium]
MNAESDAAQGSLPARRRLLYAGVAGAAALAGAGLGLWKWRTGGGPGDAAA